MQFILIHGSYGSPERGWLPQLKERLQSFDQKVFAPQFPVDNWDEVTLRGKDEDTQNQTLSAWLDTFKDLVTQKLDLNQPICIVGHSLGPLFVLHALEKFNLKLDSAIFVAPFLSKLNKSWQIDTANQTFYKTDFDFSKLKQLIPHSYVLYSESDPYVDKEYSLEFADKMGSSLIPVKNAGHMNSEVNLNEFPLVLELCKSRLDLSLYQKYIAHRKDLYEIDYTSHESEEVVYLNPEDVRDEGIFHFRNLQKGAFCTFFTGTEFWDNQSTYMVSARQAATRTQSLTRVFVVNQVKDLSNKHLIDQIDLDIQAGMHVYLVMYSSLKDDIKQPDFGIWDDEYRCLVTFDKNNQVSEIQLSSRKEDLELAKSWKEIILSKATRITDINNIQSFINQST